MNELITTVNDIIWSYVLMVALVGCDLWFTWRTRFAQFRMVGEMRSWGSVLLIIFYVENLDVGSWGVKNDV